MKLKTMKGDMPTLHYPDNIYEYMGKAQVLCAGYFNTFRAHSTLGARSEQYILPNAVYAMVRGSFAANIVGNIHLDFPKAIPDVFYDSNVRHDASSGRYYDAIKIHVAKRHAGYYIPSLNSLVLSDWTHSTDTIKVFTAIWPAMKEQLGLRGAKQEKVAVEKITVGCDPEFELIYDNDVVNAEDEIDEDDYEEEIGTDGAGDQIEIRPKPGTPIEVTQNIRNLMKKFSENFSSYNLGNEGNKYPLGGHIHVGVGFSWHPPHDLVTMLDDFIGKPTIELSGDAREDYKELSAVRSQPHGFEYRSTPSAVFHDAGIACIVMKLAKTLTEKYISGNTIQYNSRPTTEDYVKVGGLTSQQARYFMKFCSGFRPTKSMLASWRVVPKTGVVEKHTHPRVVFKDLWDTTVMNDIKDRITKKVRVNRPTDIVLYGLGIKRYGTNICTVATNAQMLAVKAPIPLWKNGNLNIGVSLDRRHDSYTTWFADSLVTEINKIIREA